jgi:multidrug efflux system membrane fusion protein
VVTAPVVRKSMVIRVEGIGNVESLSTVAVKSRIDGQIMRVRFRDGDDVEEGQILFEIDRRPAMALLKQAQAKLASDQAQLAHAKEQDARYKDLLQKNFISSDFYSQIKSNYDSAIANVQADQAAIENARLQLDYATIRSPITGRVGRIMIQQGNLVKANDTNPLVTINQLSPIYVNFSVPEQYLSQIRAAAMNGVNKVEIASPGDEHRINGMLAFIDNTVDTATGTIKLRASVPNKDAALWPGQFVHAALTIGEQKDALVVPSDAVQTGPKGTYVFIVDGGSKAQMREVVVDRAAGLESVIASGLLGGESVVVDGQSRLLPGLPVTVKPQAPRTASANP